MEMKIPNPNYIHLRFFTGQPGQWCQARQRTPQFLMGGFSVWGIWCRGLHFSCLLPWNLPVHSWKVNPQHTRGCSKSRWALAEFPNYSFLLDSPFRIHLFLEKHLNLPKINFTMKKNYKSIFTSTSPNSCLKGCSLAPLYYSLILTLKMMRQTCYTLLLAFLHF